jgi:hypothetical protein
MPSDWSTGSIRLESRRYPRRCRDGCLRRVQVQDVCFTALSKFRQLVTPSSKDANGLVLSELFPDEVWNAREQRDF